MKNIRKYLLYEYMKTWNLISEDRNEPLRVSTIRSDLGGAQGYETVPRDWSEVSDVMKLIRSKQRLNNGKKTN